MGARACCQGLTSAKWCAKCIAKGEATIRRGYVLRCAGCATAISEGKYCDVCLSAAEDALRARKDDHGKPMWELLPWDALGHVVDVLTWAVKRSSPAPYAAHSWRNVPEAVDRYADALERHLVAWRLHRQGLEGGSEVDEQSGIHHLAHAATNALFLVALVVRKSRN